MRIDDEIMSYALANPTREVCGYISEHGEVIPVPNVSIAPGDTWLMPPGAIPDGAKGVFHSHPSGPFAPSEWDMRYQIESDMPHAIAAFNEHAQEVFWFGGDVPPLVGRGFRHGVTDCYAACKDAFRLMGATLPEFPREWGWWNNGKTLYNDGFRVAGFREIELSEILPGDALLFSIRCATANHAAIWLGDGLMFHHQSARLPYDPDRLSTVENIGRMGQYISKALRYENGYIDRTACEEIRKEILT